MKLVFREVLTHKYTYTEKTAYGNKVISATYNINNWLSCPWEIRSKLKQNMTEDYNQVVKSMPDDIDFKKHKYKIQLGFVSNKSTKNIDIDGFYMCHKTFQDCLARDKRFKFNDSIKTVVHVELKYLGMREDEGDEELWVQVIQLDDEELPAMPKWMLRRYGMLKD